MKKIHVYSFEDFLKEKHAEVYHGTDDHMPDAFDSWLEDIQIDGLIELGSEFGDFVATKVTQYQHDL